MEIEEPRNKPTPHLFPDEVKWAIVIYKKLGLSNKQVAKRVTNEYSRSISHQTVQRVWSSYQESGNIENKWSSQGRPKALTDEELDLLVEDCIENRTSSVRERREALDLQASRTTINEALLGLGYKAYKAPKKPILSDNNIENRFTFAEEHADWDAEDWKNVVFSDECVFKLVNSNGRTFIRRTEEEIWEEDCIQYHQKHSQSIMVWGAISSDGVGPLVLMDRYDVEGYLNAFRYRLRRYYPEVYGDGMLFQHDNAPTHTATVTTKWFRDKGIDCLEWPSKSPDLNIIENVWGKIKYELRSQVFEDLDDLWEQVQKTWKIEISQGFINSLCESMPRRIEAVISSNGDYTKY